MFVNAVDANVIQNRPAKNDSQHGWPSFKPPVFRIFCLIGKLLLIGNLANGAWGD
jgi:hypothetical protein